MAPLEDGGVVDSQLRVHGVQCLRVCDASVYTKIVSGHTVSAIRLNRRNEIDIAYIGRSGVGHSRETF